MNSSVLCFLKLVLALSWFFEGVSFLSDLESGVHSSNLEVIATLTYLVSFAFFGIKNLHRRIRGIVTVNTVLTCSVMVLAVPQGIYGIWGIFIYLSIAFIGVLLKSISNVYA